jgi:hypothetical protein
MSYRRQQTLKEKAEFERQYNEEQARPLRNAEKRFIQTSNELARAQQQLDAMALMNEQNNPTLAERVSPFVPADPPLSVAALRLQIQTALQEASDELINQGFRFTDTAEPKIRKVLGLNKTLDFTTAAGMYEIVSYMITVGALIEGTDIASPAAVKPTPEEPKTDPLAELEAQEAVTYDGSRRARRMTEDLMASEAHPVWQQWETSLLDNFGFTINKEQRKAAFEYFRRNGLNFLHRPSYDACRRALVGQGVFPAHLLTKDEMLSQQLESTPNSLSDWATRQDYIKARNAVINQD